MIKRNDEWYSDNEDVHNVLISYYRKKPGGYSQNPSSLKKGSSRILLKAGFLGMISAEEVELQPALP